MPNRPRVHAIGRILLLLVGALSVAGFATHHHNPAPPAGHASYGYGGGPTTPPTGGYGHPTTPPSPTPTAPGGYGHPTPSPTPSTSHPVSSPPVVPSSPVVSATRGTGPPHITHLPKTGNDITPLLLVGLTALLTGGVLIRRSR